MKIKRLPALLAFITLLGMLTACAKAEGDAAIDVFVEEYGEHEVSKYITTTGTVERGSSMPFVVSTEIDSSYRVKKLYVAVGDRVKEGDKICEFDTSYIESQIADLEKQVSVYDNIDKKSMSDLQAQLQSAKQMQTVQLNQLDDKISAAQQKYNTAEQSYNTAQSNYNKAENSYNDAESGLNNAEDAEKISYYSGLCSSYQAQMTSYKSEMAQWQSTMTTCQDEIKSSQYEYELTKLQTDRDINSLQYQIDTYQSKNDTQEKLNMLKKALADSVVYSKYSGVVSEILVKEGQTTSDKNIVNIVDDNNKLIHVVLNDSDIMSVEEGMAVKVKTASDAVGELTGEVYKINRIKGQDGFDVYIKGDDFDKLNIGMGVTNSIVMFADNTLSVSKDAVRKSEDGETSYVLVAVPNSAGSYTLEKRDVTTGLESDEYIQIESENLTAGDKVVTMKNSVLREGVMVNPVEKPE